MTPVLAMAWNLLRELARKRATWLFVLLLVASALALPYAGSGDGSLRMRLQLAVTYGLGFPVFLISVATISVSAGLARDVESRRIGLLVTKPVGALRIVLGSFVGICIADAALVIVLLGAFAVNVTAIQGARQGTEEDRRVAMERFFTARLGVLPVMAPPAEAAVKAWVEAVRAGGGSPPDTSDASLEAKARHALRSLRIAPGGSAELELHGLRPGAAPPAPGEEILIRYQAYSFHPRESPRVDLDWEALAGEGSAVAAPAVRSTQVLQGVPQEVALKASAVSEDGSLRLRVRNPAPADSGVTLVIDPAKVEAMPVHGSFWPNVVRALVLVLAQLALLACLVLAASCIFTSPTAVFLGLFIYLTALSSGFLRETFALYSGESPRAASWTGRVEGWTSAFRSAILEILPDFTTVDPLGRLAAARAITAVDILREATWMVGVEGTAALIAGAWLLRRRELGR